MKTRKTRTDKGKPRKSKIARTPKELKKVFSQAKKISKSGVLKTMFQPPLENDLEFISPDEPVAVDFGGTIKRFPASKIAEALANGQRLKGLKDVPIEQPSATEFNSELLGRDEFDNAKQWKTPPPYEEPTNYSFEIKPNSTFNVKIDGRELNFSGQTLTEALENRIKADDREEEVRHLAHELKKLKHWKTEALEVFKKWDAVELYIQKEANTAKDLGRNIADIVLERLKSGNQEQFEKAQKDALKLLHQQGTPGNWDANEYMFGMYNGMELILAIFEDREPQYRDKPSKLTNGREQTPEELAADIIEKMTAWPGKIPGFLNDINSRLIEHLGGNAAKAKEEAVIATKRFEESLMILNNLKAGANTPSQPKNY